jgi:hypothetical protein
MSGTVVETTIKAVNTSQKEFDQLNRDLKRTQTEGKKATTVWDRFGKAGESAAGRAGVFGQTLAALGPIGIGVGAALGMVSTVLYSGTMSMAEWEKRLGRTEALLKSTGYAAGLTATELDNLARDRDLVTLGDRNQIMDAINVMQTFKSVTGETFRESITLAQDMSVVTGQSLTSATTMLGKALEDPIAGLNSMRRVGVSFTETEQAVIKAMAETNDLAGAQAKIMEVLRGQFEGAAEGEAKGLLGVIDTMSYEWRDLLEAMSNTDAASAAVSELTELIRAMSYSIKDLSGGFSLDDEISLLTDQVEVARNLVQSLREEGAEGRLIDWSGSGATQAALDEANGKLSELENRLRRVKALQEGSDMRDTFVIHDKGKAAAASRAKDYEVLEQVQADEAAEQARKLAQKERDAADKKSAADKASLEKTAASKAESEARARETRLARWREQLDEARLGKEYVERQRIETQARQMVADGVSQADADFWQGKQLDELTRRMLDDVDRWKLAFGEFGDEAKQSFDEVSRSIVSTFSTGNSAVDSFMQKLFDFYVMNPLQDMFMGGFSGGGGGFDVIGSIGSGVGNFFSSIFHEGGVVGGPAPARMVPADIFDGAPRYHEGGGVGPGERAIIARDGELILNAAQQSNVAAGLTGRGVVVEVPVKVENRTESKVQVRRTTGQDGGTAGIEMLITDVVDDAFSRGRFDAEIARASRRMG